MSRSALQLEHLGSDDLWVVTSIPPEHMSQRRPGHLLRWSLLSPTLFCLFLFFCLSLPLIHFVFFLFKYSWLQFIAVKGHRLKSAIEKGTEGRVLETPGTSFQLSSLSEVMQTVHNSPSHNVWHHVWSAAKQGGSPEPWCPELLSMCGCPWDQP